MKRRSKKRKKGGGTAKSDLTFNFFSSSNKRCNLLWKVIDSLGTCQSRHLKTECKVPCCQREPVLPRGVSSLEGIHVLSTRWSGAGYSSKKQARRRLSGGRRPPCAARKGFLKNTYFTHAWKVAWVSSSLGTRKLGFHPSLSFSSLVGRVVKRDLGSEV